MKNEPCLRDHPADIDVCSRMEMIGWFPSHRGERITAGSLRRNWQSLNWTRTDEEDRHITIHFPGPTQIIRRQRDYSVILWWCDYLRIRTRVLRNWKGQQVKRSLSPGPILIIYTLWTKSNHRTVRTTRSVFRSTCSKDPHPRNHLCNIVCSLLMICYVLNTGFLTAWWSRNNQKFGRVYRLDRPRTLSLKPGRGWMWGIIFRRIRILDTCGKGKHIWENLTDSNWWTSVWKIVEFISKTNADTVNHHIVKNETRNGWTCRDHAGTA